MKTKSKYFKNPDRGNDKPFQPYIPQWQLLGREPTDAATGKSPQIEPLTKNAPFVQRTAPKFRPLPTISRNVPFAEEGSATLGHAPLPNVGNNVENTWAGMEFIEDDGLSEIDVNRKMIDNNDDDPRNYGNIPKVLKSAPAPKEEAPPQKEPDSEPRSNVLQDLEANDYVLLVKGEVIAMGVLLDIQEEVRALVFEEHPLSEITPVTIDDIIVLKRVKIKVGVFIE